ncbi:hypothetical protein EJ04DRAFT_610071 [Polyplosphaeria fusca]|uniref:Uncharacterized protein n=1 Tax=Polyplosphaeria fusca TaxID=682080 RepID=A0A9P4QS60_9PLEO|nr:hypothetical protein EJ04DRAFT_610071 [Polyplosphaeria fusca]
MFSFFPLVALLAVSSIASPTPKSPNPSHVNHLIARQCGFATWDSSNLANWAEADTDAFLERWWKWYLGGNGDSTSAVIPNNWPNNFANLFGRMYLNAQEVYKCAQTDDICYGDVPCNDIKCSGEWIVGCENEDAGRPVYLTMRSLQGFQDFFKDYVDALDQTQINFNGMAAYLTDNFFPKPDAASALFLQEFFTALATVFSIGGSYAKLIPIIAGNNVAKETSGALAALLGGIGGGYRVTVRFPSDPSFQNLSELGKFMTNVFEQVRSTLNDMQFNLATGKAWQGKFFYEYAKGGAFMPGRGASAGTPGAIDSPSKTLRQYLVKQFNARAINYIWRTQKIFITYTTDVDGSCENDRQGPQDLKYCRPGDQGVYYMYYWHQKSVGAGTTLGIDSFDTAKMDYPVGWDKLAAGWIDENYQLDLKDVFEASIAAYQVAGFNYTSEIGIDRSVSALRDQWANPWDHDTKWEGTFTIPVCNTGDLSYNVQLGERIMPCNCGGDGSQVSDFKKNSNMEGYGVYDEQCTAEKQNERRVLLHGGGKGVPEINTPSLPTDLNKINCLLPDTPVDAMVSQNTYCSQAVASLGDDDSKEICTNGCSDGGKGQTSNWCRIAVDNSNIHFCALTIADKSSETGGPGSSCITVGDAKKFFANAHATTDDGGAGCHVVGSTDFGATFITPNGMTRWCLSDYENANYCTI